MVYTGPDRRERHKQKTRRALHDAALRLFARRGFQDVTIEDITDAADVAPRTYFRYFDTKEDVLFADQDELLARLGESFAQRSEDENVLVSIREALLSLADDFGDNRDEHFLRARLGIEAPSVAAKGLQIQRDWEDTIAGAVADRLGVDVENDPRPVLIAGASVAALRAATRRWVRSGGTEDLIVIFTDIHAMLESDFGLIAAEAVSA